MGRGFGANRDFACFVIHKDPWPPGKGIGSKNIVRAAWLPFDPEKVHSGGAELLLRPKQSYFKWHLSSNMCA